MSSPECSATTAPSPPISGALCVAHLARIVSIAVVKQDSECDIQSARNSCQYHERRVDATALDLAEACGVDAHCVRQDRNRDFGQSCGQGFGISLSTKAADPLAESRDDASLLCRKVPNFLFASRSVFPVDADMRARLLLLRWTCRRTNCAA